MGLLIDGQWQSDEAPKRFDQEGRFQRPDTVFRNWITPDGAPGPTGRGGFRAEPGRYHLYVSLACPWAHRTLIFRRLKGLEEMVSLSVVHWHLGADGWSFVDGPGTIPDPELGARFLREIYVAAKPDCTSRVSVPVLWDREQGTIVNNESSEIIRMFNSAFDGVGAAPGDYYPLELRGEIDALNARVYATLNNGVYRCGLARSQAAYDEAAAELFATLDMLEDRLATRRFLCGDQVTEADWRLFVTLVRFDAVYVGLFKCNLRRIMDYPNLSRYFAELRAWPGVEDTIDLHHIRHHYYESLTSINPRGIVPIGPASAA